MKGAMIVFAIAMACLLQQKGPAMKRVIMVIVAAVEMLMFGGCWSPVVMGKPYDRESRVYGLHVHPLWGSARNVVGIDASVIGTGFDDRPSVEEMCSGLAIGLVSSGVEGEMRGLQIAGLTPAATNLKGVQIGLLSSYVEQCFGLQVGLFNIAGAWGGGNKNRCVQLGLFNLCGDHWFPLFNVNFRDCESCDASMFLSPW